MNASYADVENIKPFRIVLDENKHRNFLSIYKKYLKGLYDGPVSANYDEVKKSLNSDYFSHCTSLAR